MRDEKINRRVDNTVYRCAMFIGGNGTGKFTSVFTRTVARNAVAVNGQEDPDRKSTSVTKVLVLGQFILRDGGGRVAGCLLLSISVDDAARNSPRTLIHEL